MNIKTRQREGKVATKIVLCGIALLIGFAGFVWLGRLLIPAGIFAFKIRSVTIGKQRQLLYEIDHQALATELRKFASVHRWNSPSQTEFDHYSRDSVELPETLRALNPSLVRIYDDRIEFDCGGAFLSFGIVVYREGLAGEGTKKLGAGIWFYSEDGKVPKPPE